MSGTAVGLDFGAVMAVGQARGADPELLSEALPDIEIAIIAGANGDPDGED